MADRDDGTADLEDRQESIAGDDVGAVPSYVAHDFGIVGHHDDCVVGRDAFDLVTNDVVSDGALWRIHNSGQPPTRSMRSYYRCTIEDHRDVGAEPSGQVLDRIEHHIALLPKRTIRPAELGHVVTVDDELGV